MSMIRLWSSLISVARTCSSLLFASIPAPVDACDGGSRIRLGSHQLSSAVHGRFCSGVVERPSG
eukprot:6078557-Heterocapsa_arctica.AAC.1